MCKLENDHLVPNHDKQIRPVPCLTGKELTELVILYLLIPYQHQLSNNTLLEIWWTKVHKIQGKYFFVTGIKFCTKKLSLISLDVHLAYFYLYLVAFNLS